VVGSDPPPTGAGGQHASVWYTGKGGGPAGVGCHGVVGQLLADVGRFREKWKMGPTQEAQGRFHIYSKKFEKNQIDLIRKGPSRALKISNKIYIWSFWNKEQLSLLEVFKIMDIIWIKNWGSSRVWNSIEFEWNFQELMEFDWGSPDCT
jgi:hypothetical protein